jgi:hypothetical protein
MYPMERDQFRGGHAAAVTDRQMAVGPGWAADTLRPFCILLINLTAEIDFDHTLDC